MVAAHDSRAAPVTLVGRERERQFLRSQLDAALAGHGSLMLISGEAGVGKTALADDLCQLAQERGAHAIAGHCYDLTETPPYGPWRELISHTSALGLR
jgi:predicted ATPase